MSHATTFATDMHKNTDKVTDKKKSHFVICCAIFIAN